MTFQKRFLVHYLVKVVTVTYAVHDNKHHRYHTNQHMGSTVAVKGYEPEEESCRQYMVIP